MLNLIQLGVVGYQDAYPVPLQGQLGFQQHARDDVEGSRRKFAGLMRVDKAGKVIEFQYGSYSVAEATLVFPETIDPNRETYWIHYRQE